MSHQPVIDRLQHLVQVNRDAEGGFVHAANEIKNSELETTFAGYAKQHADFAAELDTEIQRLGGEAADPAKRQGPLHQGWLNLKAVLFGDSAATLLSACEDAEQNTISAYLDATDEITSGHTHTLLQKQCDRIQSIHKRLSRLVGEIKDGVEFPKNE